MKNTWITKVLLFYLAITVGIATLAQVAIPPLTTHVTDVAGTLTSEQKATLEKNLTDFETKAGSQIAVLIVPSTAPEQIEQYSLRVVEQWKLGRKKIDDGAVLIIARNDRVMRIEVGYGLEGALNDAVSKRIISEVITPRFKQGDYYDGIAAGLNSMMQVISGEALPAPTHATGSTDFSRSLPVVFIAVLALGGFLRSLLGRFPGAIVTGGITGILAWFFMGALSISLSAAFFALVVTMFSGGMRGMGRGYYGGGGGMGGGGFSGGGGGFGGGGASGRW